MAVNPNAKVPMVVDGTTTVFDSSAILLYQAEKAANCCLTRLTVVPC
jgi:glutathione S-transferase